MTWTGKTGGGGFPPFYMGVPPESGNYSLHSANFSAHPYEQEFVPVPEVGEYIGGFLLGTKKSKSNLRDRVFKS